MAQLAALLLMAITFSSQPGCAAGSPEPPEPTAADVSPAEFRFVEERVDAVAGRTLVLPIEFAAPVGGRPGAYTARLSDGRSIEARLARLIFEPGDERIDSPEDQWLPSPGRLAVVYPSATEALEPARGRGFWTLSIDLPPDAAGLNLSIENQRAPIRWIAPPPTLFPPDVTLPRRPRIRAPSAAMVRALLPWSKNPLHRWRVNLLGERLAIYGAGAALAGPPLDDPLLEALAVQTELRWRTALSRLAEIDPPLALKLLERLTLIIRFSETREAPAWPARSPRLTRLLSDLLDRELSPAELARVARAWLQEQPECVAWIIDDLGRPASEERTVITAGVANLGVDRRTARLERARGGSGPPGATPGRTARSLALTAPLGLAPVRLRATLGAESTPLLARTSSIPATPPGAPLGPLLRAWTMPSWLAGTPQAAPEEGAAFALLQPRDDAPGWEIYLECRAPADADGRLPDVVRLFFGPLDAPRAALRVNAQGVMHDETDPFSEPTSIEVDRRADRWTAFIPVPEGALEPEGDRLLIGILRRDWLGRVSSWPRPVLPWDESPPRAAIDLTTWRSLAADERE